MRHSKVHETSLLGLARHHCAESPWSLLGLARHHCAESPGFEVGRSLVLSWKNSFGKIRGEKVDSPLAFFMFQVLLKVNEFFMEFSKKMGDSLALMVTEISLTSKSSPFKTCNIKSLSLMGELMVASLSAIPLTTCRQLIVLCVWWRLNTTWDS